jgi:acyl-CoA reductase-like NAD-dependent aldehyde dehydrogenase
LDAFLSTNPTTEHVVARFPAASPKEADAALGRCHSAWMDWRRTPLEDRLRRIGSLADYLSAHRRELASLITLEMGKPIVQSEAEIDKCAAACRHFEHFGADILAPVKIPVTGATATVRYDALGVVLAIMPWNFPFWQLIRPGIPAVMAGNTILLKHAPNVPQCALAIEKAFLESGFPDGVITNVFADTDLVPDLIADDRIQGVTLTGSERAGAAVGALAGRNIKRSVLELGGSDAFIVCVDADIEQAATLAVRARTQNAGQSCIASKRFLVARSVFERFVDRFTAKLSALQVGDPFDTATDMGPMARADLAEALARQVEASVAAGATLLTGGRRIERPGYFFQPTLLTGLPTEAPAWAQETFGPVAAALPFDSEDEAIAMANASRYGLGATICTNDHERSRGMAERLEVGMVFVNALVASDARLPFGGVKKSGYGRELAELGAREFTNVKTVYHAHAD